MPTIKERLQEDWKEALKSKDKFRANVLSSAKSAVLLVEKNDGVTLEDDKVIEILAKEVKQRKEAMFEFEKGIDRIWLIRINLRLKSCYVTFLSN